MSKINSNQIKGGGGGSSNLITVPFSFASISPIVLQSVTSGQIIYESSVIITTVFNDPTATFKMGTTTSPGLVFNTGEVSVVSINQYDNEGFITIPNNDILIATISPGGSTQGVGVIYYYIQ